jgi:hypothetical protein
MCVVDKLMIGWCVGILRNLKEFPCLFCVDLIFDRVKRIMNWINLVGVELYY